MCLRRVNVLNFMLTYTIILFSKYSRIQVLAELVLLMALNKMAKKRRSLRRWRGSIASNKASWVTCENAECVKMYFYSRGNTLLC